LTDIGIDPEDPVSLVICFHLNAQQFGTFTKEEFVAGFEKLNCDSIEKIQNVIPELRGELDDPSLLKEIYKYTFDFSKESEQKKRNRKRSCCHFTQNASKWKTTCRQFYSIPQFARII